MSRTLRLLRGARVAGAVCVLTFVGLLAAPARVDAADAVFTWVPTDGSQSSGTMTIDVPSEGQFTLSDTAVRALTFTFRPGFTVTLSFGRDPATQPVMSFDGGGLDYGIVALRRVTPFLENVVFSFLPEQLGSDTVFHELFGPNSDTVERLRGHWVRLDRIVSKPPLPLGLAQAIDIRSVYGRHPAGNMLGLAYDTQADVLYVSHQGIPGQFIYTLDMSGRVLRELDFEKVYRAGASPSALSYDPGTGHLFVFTQGAANGIGNLVEMSVDGSTVFREIPLPTTGTSAPIVRPDGIWQQRTTDRVLRHYSRDGVFIEDIALDSSLPGNFGLLASAASFPGRGPNSFFLSTGFGQEVFEIDGAGRQVGVTTTRTLGDTVPRDGRAGAITGDAAGPRLFLLGNNNFIFVLNPDFIRIQNVNDLLRVDNTAIRVTLDRTPVPGGPSGRFLIDAPFENVSGRDICGVFFQVNQLQLTNGVRAHALEQIVSLPDGEQIQGYDEVRVGHRPFRLPASSVTWVRFTLDLTSLLDFRFFVDAFGAPQSAGPCP